MSIDVVLQGQVFPYTEHAIQMFKDEDWIGKIIVSTWEGEPAIEGVEMVFNKDVEHPGVGNRNRQIKSSAEGLQRVSTKEVIKARTDQIIYDLPLMKRFYDSFQTGSLLFTCGMYKAFPFHPRDHFFMGRTRDVVNLFNASYDPYNGPPDYSQCLRAEAWIGSQYFARFSHQVEKMCEQPLKYLVDGAPNIEEALALDFSMRDSLFKVFPRINFAWPKHRLQSYHYHVGESLSEYWHEEQW